MIIITNLQMRKLGSWMPTSFCLPWLSKVPKLTAVFSWAGACHELWKFCLNNITVPHFQRKICVFLSFKFQPVYRKWRKLPTLMALPFLSGDFTRSSDLALCTCPFVVSTFKELRPPGITKPPLLCFLSHLTSIRTVWSWAGGFLFAASCPSEFSFTFLPSTFHQMAILL